MSIWPKSAATPGVCTMSYKFNWVTAGFNLSNKDRGCPIPVRENLRLHKCQKN